MSAVDEILANLPLDQIAARVGARPEEVEAAAAAALPALLGGLQANAADPGGASSIAEAITQHDEGLADGPVELDRVDVADGEKIARHIFGPQQDQVVQRLGGIGGGVSSGLVQKLLPMLAPVVLSYLARQMSDQGAGEAAGGGVLDTVLGEVLKGVGQGARSGSGGAGSIIGDLLGGLLGGGRTSP